MKTIRIAVTGGGSGGHTMPAVAMIETLQKQFAAKQFPLELMYIGSRTGLERKIAANQPVRYYSIATGKLRRYFSFRNFTDLFLIAFGLVQSFILFLIKRPHLVFSTGGFVSVPPVIAAFFLRIPAVIHEQTIDAGLANRISGRFARRICLTFQESSRHFPQSKIRLTGIPQRDVIFDGDKSRYLSKYPLDSSLPVLFFTGGGLGCHILNDAALTFIPEMLNDFNIIYQSGNSNQGKDFAALEILSQELPEKLKSRFRLYNFISGEIGDIYASADLVIGRSGAGTVNELLTLRIPAIFIPLAIAANQEQHKNARIMTEAGAALLIEEADLNPENLMLTIRSLFCENKIEGMRTKLEEKNCKRGNQAVLDVLLEFLK